MPRCSRSQGLQRDDQRRVAHAQALCRRPRKDRDVAAEDRRAVAIKVLRHPNAWTRPTQQTCQGRAASFPRVPAQVLAVEREQVEAEEEDGPRAASA